MQALTYASQGLQGTLTIPGDKSISHRALMIGALAEGQTEIENFLAGQDCLSTLRAFQDLGVEIERQEDRVKIQGCGLQGLKAPDHPLDMGNSGTTTRLMMGLLSGTNFATTLSGDASLQKRPMRRVSQPLAEFGVKIETTPTGTLPLTVYGGPVKATKVELTVASAQVKSALLLAALSAPGTSVIKELLPTRNHTEIMLRQFGAQLETAADGLTITVKGQPQLKGQKVIVPGDMSSAAFFMVAATIIPHSEITLTNVNLNSTRTGILSILLQMGADITVHETIQEGERRGNLTVRSAKLHGIEIGAPAIPAVIDELPLVALAAACAQGVTEIRGAQELRVKETDRITTMVTLLRQLGVTVQEHPDGMTITGRDAWQVVDPNFDSFGDHRLGMVAAIAALKSSIPMNLKNADAIAISYPTFFQDLDHLCQKG